MKQIKRLLTDIKGIEPYQKSSYDWLVKVIYESNKKNPKKSILKIYLCEVDDPKIDLYEEALKTLKSEGVITNYKTIIEVIPFVNSKSSITEANMIFDFENYINDYNSEREINSIIDSEEISDDHSFSVIIKRNDINLTKIKKLITNKKYVEKIELVNGKGLTVYINGNYLDPIKTNIKAGSNGYWKKISDLANGAEIKNEPNIVKYFNYNKKNPIYFRGEYELTNILSGRGKTLRTEIPISVITQESINRKLGQKK